MGYRKWILAVTSCPDISIRHFTTVGSRESSFSVLARLGDRRAPGPSQDLGRTFKVSSNGTRPHLESRGCQEQGN